MDWDGRWTRKAKQGTIEEDDAKKKKRNTDNNTEDGYIYTDCSRC
jgi:hypothetical protein